MTLTDAILLGAGSGTRFSRSERSSNQLPKQFQQLGAYPVFIWALLSLIENLKLRRVVIVVAPEHLNTAHQLVNKYLPFSKGIQIEFVSGGNQRQDSSMKGIEAISNNDSPPDFVLIHDACRPFIGPVILNELKAKISSRTGKAWIPVVPVTETLKKVRNHKVLETVDRTELFRVQTPQLFEFSLISTLFQKLINQAKLKFTDDASVLEHFGLEVGTFPGDERNIKLTYEFESEIIHHHLKNEGRINPCASETATTSIV